MKKCDVVVLEKCFIYYEKTEDELKAERDEEAERTRGRHRHVGTQHWNDRPLREAHHV